MQDLTGKKFNMLTVIGEDVEFNSIPRKGYYTKWICECDCGNEKSVGASHLKNGQIKSCGCLNRRKKNENPLFNGVGEISGGFWYDKVMRRVNKSATHRSIEVSITPKYAWDIFLNQGGKCALSGWELKFPEHGKDSSHTASLDRIDSSVGYVEGNVQWVHKHINIMKNKFDQDYFIKMCKLISDTHTTKICDGDSCTI